MNTQPDTPGKVEATYSSPVIAAGDSEKIESEKVESGSGGEAMNTPTTPPPKKKRKSPEKPWKKPADMPKRPLSGYNLFFQDEKNRLKAERISKKGSVPKKGEKKEGENEGESTDLSSKRKHVAVSGIGFANLAKTVAAKWKSLDAETRAPYEERAAVDKARYDKEVAAWREKQKEKKAREKAAKSQADMSPFSGQGVYLPDIQLAPSDHSIASLSAIDHTSDWFQSNQDPAYDPNIPPHIQMTTEDSSRMYGQSSGQNSPPPNAYGSLGPCTQHNSTPMMSPIDETHSPHGASYGFNQYHNQSLGIAGSRSQIPPLPGTQNSYSHNIPMPFGGNVHVPYQLSPRRSAPSSYMSGMSTEGQEWSRNDSYHMQQSPMQQQVYMETHDAVSLPFNDGLPHHQQQMTHPFQSANQLYDSYPQQQQVPLGAGGYFHNTQNAQYHQQPPQGGRSFHNTYHEQYNSQMQQPRPASMPQQQLNQPVEFIGLDDTTMDYITRLRENKESSDGLSRRNFPGNP